MTGIPFFCGGQRLEKGGEGGGGGEIFLFLSFFAIPHLQRVNVGVDGVERALGLGSLDEGGGVGRSDLLHAAGLG